MAAEYPPDVVRALIYQETYAPAALPQRREWPALNPARNAPSALRTAVAAGWAVVGLITAGGVGTVVVVVLVRIVGALT